MCSSDLSEQAVAGVVAIAVLVPLAAGHYDLSVGATANLTGITPSASSFALRV